MAVRRALSDAGLLNENARLLCGVSGGCDSVTLLHTLCLLRSEVPFELHVLHVQHGLRGEDSLEDERFVRRLCRELQVPLWVEDAGLCGSMQDPGMETRARERRRELFETHMRVHGMHALITAHHRDDQTETVLMHLLRGAGAQGLQGMKPCVPFGPGLLLRPFLNIPRVEIEQAGYEYRQDQSNGEALTPRNALRLEVLPALEKLFPGAGAHVAQAAQRIGADEEALMIQAQSLLEQAVYRLPPLMFLDARMLNGQPRAAAARVLRLWWLEGLAQAGITPDERALSHADTEALQELLHSGCGTCNLPFGLMAQAGSGRLYLLRQSGEPLKAAHQPETDVLEATQGDALVHATVRQIPHQSAPPATAEEIILPPEVLREKPVFRNPRPDDRIHPLGAPGSKPLRRYLTDRKIDPALRPALVVLAAGNEILWIPSICTAERLRAVSPADGSVRLRGVLNYLPH